MPRRITDRALRDDAFAIIEALDSGESFVVTRDGKEVAELRPLPARRFVKTEEVLAAFAGSPYIDLRRFAAELDDVVEQWA
jgi:antitoxin (DNA-binding transcriptional repressor) of toxin-antitoxin stability system